MHTPASDKLRGLIAGEVRANMARNRLTIHTAAEQSGIPQSTLSRRLSEQSPFTVEELATLAHVFRVDLHQLLCLPHSTAAVAA